MKLEKIKLTYGLGINLSFDDDAHALEWAWETVGDLLEMIEVIRVGFVGVMNELGELNAVDGREETKS
jgi:hypothetical protein